MKICIKCNNAFPKEYVGHDVGSSAGDKWYCSPKCFIDSGGVLPEWIKWGKN